MFLIEITNIRTECKDLTIRMLLVKYCKIVCFYKIIMK
jgi:hypothetical protein